MRTGGRKGWLARMRAGLGKSSSRLVQGIGGLFAGRKLDEALLGELEELLIASDLGVTTAMKLTGALDAKALGRDAGEREVRAALAGRAAQILAPVAKPLVIDPANHPHVVLVVGVNGTGKTTTIGKLAGQWRAEGRSVMLAAGDTFRAAAIAQLQAWGERAGAPVVARAPGSDPAAVAFEALERARAEGADVLLIDTAGRLHNKADLMAELAKIVRVLGKLDPGAPHARVLVLDATTGQNAHAQVETFGDLINLTGLIVTKLDGTAKGGVVVALADRFGLPIHAIGVGERLDDLRPFDAKGFADGLLGLEPAEA